MKKDYIVESVQGKPIRFTLNAPEKVDAVVLVIHGMQEHSGRYAEFIERQL